MFVAAPGLIRSIWRIKVSKPPPESSPSRRRAGGAANDRRERPRRRSPAARAWRPAKALRDCALPWRGLRDVRGPCVLLRQPELRHGRPVLASDRQGGRGPARPDDGRRPVAHRRRSPPARSESCSSSGAHPFGGGPGSASWQRPGSSPSLGGAPQRQAGQPVGHARAAASSSPRRSRWAPSPASCPSAAACSTSRSKARCSWVRASPRWSRACADHHRQRAARDARRHRRGDDRRRPARPAAGLAGHPPQGGPDHRRHGHQHRRGRHHQLPVPAVPEPEHRATTRRRASRRCAFRSWRTSRSWARSCSRTGPTSTSTVLAVIALTYMLFRTRWGLRLRASGEKPAAAGTVGINVLAIRYQSLLLAGMICGLAGSYLSLASGGRLPAWRSPPARASSRSPR